jgi:diguanylate cyclase (GGDEF)-like protein
VAEVSLAIGYLQYLRGDMDDALTNLQRAYDINTALGDEAGKRSALGYIAHVYADVRIGEYDKAIEYYQKLLSAHQESGLTAGVADATFNIASTYERKGEFGAALEWYQRALAAEESIPRPEEAAYVKRSIGVTLGKLGRPREALPHFAAALAVYEKANDRNTAMMVRQSRGIVYLQLGRLPEAIAELDATRRWFDENSNARFLEKSEEQLALAYAAAGRWREAYEARTRYAKLQGVLATKAQEEHTSRLRVQFDTARTEQENRALLSEQAAAARIRDLQTLVLMLGAGIIAILLFLALRLKRDSRRMQVIAQTDELTRLPNRRHLLAVAEELLDHSFAAQTPLALVAFDIDHFKDINDRYGHAVGDQVLQKVAHTCRLALRPNDRLGRVGGEEFVAVLPGTAEGGALSVAIRLRVAVEMLAFESIDPGLRVTISLGVAQRSDTDTLAQLTARADARLYQAKEGGRNRVEPARA